MSELIIDNSLIRLKPTLAEALDMDDSKTADIFCYEFVKLRTDETYLQITNSEVDIVFNGNAKIEIITCCEDVLFDITSNVAIYEGTNSETGIKNIAFEIVNIGKAFGGKRVLLRFTNTVDSSVVFYSNFFNISDDSDRTTYVEYKGYNVEYGFDYNTFDFTQKIRCGFYFTKPTNETEKKSYLQSTGNRIASESIVSLSYNHVIEYISNFFQEQFSTVIEHNIIYLDGIRATQISFTTEDLLGSSNFYTGKLTAYKNKRDKLNIRLQIFPNFDLLTRSPLGYYTLATVPATIYGKFNVIKTLGAGKLTLWNKTTGAIVKQFLPADITSIDEEFTAGLTGLITTNGDYYITIDSGLFISENGQSFEITNDTDWAFNVSDGDWLSTDWLSTDWLIHT